MSHSKSHQQDTHRISGCDKGGMTQLFKEEVQVF